MPVCKSAIKRMKTSRKRHARNLVVQSELKTILKKIDGLISSNKADEAKELIQMVMSKLDKAVSKGVIHKKKASRKISRLARQVNQLSSS